MDEHRIKVEKTARYVVLGDLADAREVWFVMHGYGQLAKRFARRFEPALGDGRLIVAPEALNRYYFETAPGIHAQDAGIGATWMTREEREHEIADYVAYLDSLYEFVIGGLQRTPARVVALGFSQGAATAARWVARGTARITELVLWGGFLPPEIVPSATALRVETLTFVHGRQDQFASETRIAQESARLNAAGMQHRVIPFTGGHEIRDEGLLALRSV